MDKQDNKKAAFLAAYDEHSDALFRHCLFKVSDRELAKDLVQEAFTKAWTYLSKGHEVANMRAFLYKTLNNLIIDEYRKKKSVSLDSLADEGFDPRAENLPNDSDILDGARAVALLSKLDDPYKDAVFLRYVNGLEISEIAKITGNSENTVSVHIHRGIKKLKELYER
jgi:RNA polymerase sigma-70 factor (ECF subfamily)